MKFRPHRELLEDAMREVIDLPATEEALRDCLKSFYKIAFQIGHFTPQSKLGVEPYCFDDRINWNTHIVTLDGQAVGFTDGPLSK